MKSRQPSSRRARSGERPSRGGYDMTDGRAYALLCVALVQRRAGDSAGARKTLREAFEVVRDHPKMRGRDGRYSQIAGAQIAGGDLADALLTVGAMLSESGPKSSPTLRALRLRQETTPQHGRHSLSR